MVVVDLAIVPKNVWSPVAITKAIPFPEVKLQPVLAMFFASVRSLCFAFKYYRIISDFLLFISKIKIINNLIKKNWKKIVF